MLRHRVERGEAERFIEGLLGLKLERAHYERGQAFVDGVVERAGLEGLNRLWDEPVDAARPPTSSTRPASGWPASTSPPQTDADLDSCPVTSQCGHHGTVNRVDGEAGAA